MQIIRGSHKIELTPDEIYAAHKEFVTAWMIDTARGILNDENDIYLSAEDYINIGESAYDIYSAGDGYTEYEAVQEAVNEFKQNYENDHIDDDLEEELED